MRNRAASAFRSVILPPLCRRSPKVAEVLPLLYLHGLSTGDFVPALEGVLGSTAGLSSASITRLSKQWSEDYHAFCQRDLSGVDYVYVYMWVDGIHVNVRLEEDKLCLLVTVGVRADGTKQLVALADGCLESTGSWADLLRDCAACGMRGPGPGRRQWRVGFLGRAAGGVPGHPGAALLVPQGRQRPVRAAPNPPSRGRRAALAVIYNAEDKRHAQSAAKAFANTYGGEVSQGHREDHRRPGRAAQLLRLPARTLDPPAHVQPDRVDVCYRPAPHPDHQRPRQPRRRAGHGVQTHRNQRSNGGGRSTHHTCSPSSAPEPTSSGAFSSNVPKRPPDEPAAGADGNLVARTRPGNRPHRPTRRGKERGGTSARRRAVPQRPPALRRRLAHHQARLGSAR
jgi:Transposase, Mutator family